MNIEITIANEAQLIEEYRAYLRRNARLVVAGRPERAGKRFAQVTFRGVTLLPPMLMVEENEAYKVEFV